LLHRKNAALRHKRPPGGLRGAGRRAKRRVMASGTDSTRAPEWSPDGPFFILVRPQLGENIGAAARAMWNFGLERMRLVSPRDGWPNPSSTAMASGASAVLDAVQVFADTDAATADLGRVYATTARPRDLTKQVMSPEQAVADMAARIAAGDRVGVLFGPERSGLEQDDVIRANVIISVATNPAFASINLAQASLLIAYEWRKAAGMRPARAEALAPAADVTAMLEHLFAELAPANYFWPALKGPALRAHLENLFRRAPLTAQDVRSLRGVIKALSAGRAGRVARLIAPDPATCADMEALRGQIDAIDRALMALFAQREAHIARAVEIKQGLGLPARIPERVAQVLDNVRAAAEAEGLDPAPYAELWRALIDRAIAFEEKTLRD